MSITSVYLRKTCIISLLLLEVSSCSFRQPLSEELSERPINNRISSCLLMYSLSNEFNKTNDIMKKCIINEIYKNKNDGIDQISHLELLGFSCKFSDSSCTLESKQRLYGLDHKEYIQKNSKIFIVYKFDKITSLIIEQETTDAHHSNTIITDNTIPATGG